MLRYQLYECSKDEIEIEKEVQYIRNYVGIQMLRKNEKYHCELSVSEDVRNFNIAPLLLTPFIENAFKYVSNHSAGKNKISIGLEFEKGKFIFNVRNDKDNLSPVEISESKGIGLVNVRRRLELLYADRHELEVLNSESEFNISLALDLNSKSMK
jgi:LytS/YehU family sensor histidine kinase